MSQITVRLMGKRLMEALTNGWELVLRTEDGGEVKVIWVDDNGKVIKGRPVILSSGVYMKARGMHELINAPRP